MLNQALNVINFHASDLPHAITTTLLGHWWSIAPVTDSPFGTLCFAASPFRPLHHPIHPGSAAVSRTTIVLCGFALHCGPWQLPALILATSVSYHSTIQLASSHCLTFFYRVQY